MNSVNDAIRISTEERCLEIIEEVADGTVSEHMKLSDLPCDSLEMLEMFHVISEMFHVELTPQSVAHLATVGQLCCHVATLVKNKAAKC